MTSPHTFRQVDDRGGGGGAPSRRRALGLMGGAAAAAFLSGCAVVSVPNGVSTVGLSKGAAPGRKKNIEVYNNQGAPTGMGVVEMAKAFEASHPDIGVKVTYSPIVTQDVQPKLLTAIAGGQPPDVGMVGQEYVPMWSRLGMMEELTPMVHAAGIKETDYAGIAGPRAWIDNRVWALQWEGDPNFPLFWNKDLFEKAGLDPDTPPTFVTDTGNAADKQKTVDYYAGKLLKHTGGLISQIAIVPWDVYGFANSMYTWGFSFGGKFLSADGTKLTPEHPLNIKALQWMTAYAKAAGGVAKLATTPPGLTLHPFAGGHIGMAPLVGANFQAIRTAQPKMRIGGGLLPYQPPGASAAGQGAWLGGWSFFIPKGARDPEAAWEFIRWTTATNAGATAEYKKVGYIPVYSNSDGLRAARTDPNMAPYWKTLMSLKNQRPLTPGTSLLANSMEKYVSSAVFGQMSAEDALHTAGKEANDFWQAFNKQVGTQLTQAKAMALLRHGNGQVNSA
ncbi:hypothetical protein BIV57_14430 [Mangrovactinospora gilvigrisea]|uniref:ABC transporter substrate-binding protein n=1 Tax=Mangrovactinospora gilvigrisea TaxID=1428644 RepID=A0A1J7CAW8_9ACTN|nr:extracellular solute-binding protein [Mangrovactinospora gilvigrisea]OIV36794.1 hypothetical protein BIV57_14430 [Mangrovactinospora gilvigrisea]